MVNRRHRFGLKLKMVSPKNPKNKILFQMSNVNIGVWAKAATVEFLVGESFFYGDPEVSYQKAVIALTSIPTRNFLV